MGKSSRGRIRGGGRRGHAPSRSPSAPPREAPKRESEIPEAAIAVADDPEPAFDGGADETCVSVAALARAISLEDEPQPRIWTEPAATNEESPVAEPRTAAAGNAAVFGQILLGLSLALFSQDVQQLTPWDGAGGGALATALLLPAIALLYGPLLGLLEDFRRQGPEFGAKVGRAIGMMSVGGGLALALAGLASGPRSPGAPAHGAESFVRQWAANAGLGLHREGASSVYHFSYTANLDNGLALTIGLPKGRESHLAFASELRLDARRRGLFETMSKQSQRTLVASLSKDLSGHGVTLRMEPEATIHLESLAPIGALSEGLLDAKLAEMKSALTAARGAVQRQLY